MSRHEIILRDKNPMKAGHSLDIMIPNVFFNSVWLSLVFSGLEFTGEQIVSKNRTFIGNFPGHNTGRITRKTEFSGIFQNLFTFCER